ncbi:hypothetical protein LEN26_003960 [Aphanomyces euteiches]|nr:hypothetical protein AeMF1_019630 [Aphanomyces euteiches]KAH9150992.1 hypothetical protein LEN26_003960 [Aphanomyces euteiches]KAH9182773.1 hypothetical protein AeNC1_015252 [Aphanomyces euteiches]
MQDGRGSLEAPRKPVREEKPGEQAVPAQEVLRMAIAEGSDMLEHINEMKLSVLLEALGAPVSEEYLVITLFCSLPVSYKVLITALESRSDALSWKFVTSHLLHEETKR